MVVVTAWAFWHRLAQAFGFARIYDSKVGFRRADGPARQGARRGRLRRYRDADRRRGRDLRQARARRWHDLARARDRRDAAIGRRRRRAFVVAAAYVANLVATIVAGRPELAEAVTMHVTTIGYYWFAFAWLPNVLIAHVLYELFHDIQYFAITWITCQGRSRRPGVTRWMRSMFRPSLAGGCGLYRDHGRARRRRRVRPTSFDAGMLRNVWLGVFVTLALLHYYYDGFIWKARESALGADLGIQHGRAAVVPSARHAAAVRVLLAARRAGLHRRPDPAARARRRARGHRARRLLQPVRAALALTRERKLEDALARYQHAISLNPDFGPTHVLYGAALELRTETQTRRATPMSARSRPPSDRSHVDAHVNLGALLAESGTSQAAARTSCRLARPGSLLALSVCLACRRRCRRAKQGARGRILRPPRRSWTATRATATRGSRWGAS